MTSLLEKQLKIGWRISLLVCVFIVIYMLGTRDRSRRMTHHLIPAISAVSSNHTPNDHLSSLKPSPTYNTKQERLTYSNQHEIPGTISTFTTHHRSGTGYMFALEYSDQGTGSWAVLMTFLCFATHIGGVRIVEPFMPRSMFGLNISANLSNELRFSDIFSVNAANMFTRGKRVDMFVSFEEFLRDSPRNLLVAQHRCLPDMPLCGKIPCGGESALKLGQTFSERYGFNLVGQVCLKYNSGGTTPLKEIENQLYKDFKKSEITVMFVHFGGVHKGAGATHRLNIVAPNSCYSDYAGYRYIRPSKLVEQSAQSYIKKYLSTTKYISVMIRMERVILVQKNNPEIVQKCLDRVVKTITDVRSKLGIRTTFLCLDVGKYGSDWITMDNNKQPLTSVYDSFISGVLGKNTTLSELDNTFSQTTLRDNPGFVAMMQKLIVANGDALILLSSGSNYQKSAKELFLSKNKRKKVFEISSHC